jgi:hypothetical protein
MYRGKVWSKSFIGAGALTRVCFRCQRLGRQGGCCLGFWVGLLAAGVTSSCSGWVVVSIYDVRVGFLSGVSLARWCVYRTGVGATLPARGVAPVGDFPGHGASPRCPHYFVFELQVPRNLVSLIR